MARASYCGKCGETHKPGECKMENAQASGPRKSSTPLYGGPRKGQRTPVMNNATKKQVEEWAKTHDVTESGTEAGRKRHYEWVEDPDNPGYGTMVVVTDE